MRRNTILTTALGLIILLAGACNSDTWDEMPQAIANFVSEYFPFGELESYTESNNIEVVKIKKGATLTFDSNYQWIDVNGNGSVLPSQYLYDQLPDALWRYIEEGENQNNVYRVQRSGGYITILLHSTEIKYNQDTGEITYPSTPTTAS